MSSAQRLIGYLGKATEHGREVLNLSRPTVSITNEHQHTHDEKSFLASYSLLRDDTESMELRVEVVDEEPHMVIHFDAALAATLEIWYPTTKTDVPGNRLVNINRWLGSSNASPILICHTPSGSQAGAATITRYVGSTGSGFFGIGASGGSGNSRGELIIPKGDDLLVRFTSRSNGNALSIILDWYETAL